MKVFIPLFASLACTASVGAQYFSAGWSPGQPAPPYQAPSPATAAARPSVAPPPPNAAPAASDGGLFDISRILTSGPVDQLFSKMGVNITEKMELAKKDAIIWDPRIPLITDYNYDELIVNEPLTPEEEEDRVWFLIITVSAGGKNPFSRLADGHFDKAYNLSVIENDLPNVRWGRIDYLNVTYLTTKWSIWQAPYLVVATDRGKSLRFYKGNSVRLDPDIIREFLREEGWRESEPWASTFGPGGDKEYLMHYFAFAMTKSYEYLVRVPRWVLMLASGGVANLIMRYIHRNDAAPTEPVIEEKPTEKPAPLSLPVPAGSSTTTSAPASTTGASPSKGKGRQRKGAKK
ncbi:hypothetical protein B0H21DRAFT_689421 [Amylocystis lapponica]|nr:hypothetical protein B0H21DRAFT_689421 [Amylocystis lapponica]